MAVVSPPSPLFIRQTMAERPSVPAIRRTSLWLAVVNWPSLATMLMAWSNSFSVRRTSRAKPCRCVISDCRISFRRGSAVRRVSSRTATVS